jgi:hypothetical protein
MPADLIVLVADKNAEYGMRGLLSRPQALGIRRIEFEVYVHPQRDPGCARRAHDFLRPFASRYARALVVFDREGCGRNGDPVDAIAKDVKDRLAANGWGDRADAIVLDPELEAWVFGSWRESWREVERCLGWQCSTRLRDWLADEGLWSVGRPKPDCPKEALERALRAAGRPRSSAIYECLGRRVSLQRCSDPQFNRLRTTLARWFPAGGCS